MGRAPLPPARAAAARVDNKATVCFQRSGYRFVRKGHTMATDRMALVDVLRKGQDPEVDFLKEGVRWLVQELMEAEVSAQIGADRYARSDERTTQRTGYRPRPWDARVGTLELAIPYQSSPPWPVHVCRLC